MISFENLIALIKECKTPYIRIFDHYGNPLFSFDDDRDIEATVKKLQHVAPMLENCGKCTVQGATENIKKASWRGAYKWQVSFAAAPMGQQKNDFGYNMNWNMGMVPKGYVPESMMSLQMQHFKEMSEVKLKMMEMQMQMNNSRYPIPPEYLPYIGKFLGWSPDEMRGLAGASLQTKINGTPEVHSTLRFKDVQKMSAEEKIKKINELLTQLESKVSAEHMILLLEALNEKPELADKAVRAFQAGII